MKMKRMEMQDVTVGNFQFKIRPLAAMNAAYVFGDVAAIVLPIIGVATMSGGDKKDLDLEIFEGVNLDAKALTVALGNINGKALTKLISELTLNYNNVSYFDDEASSWKPLDDDAFDEIFCMNFAGAIALCVEVVRQKYSGFFSDIVTLFGKLMTKYKVGDQRSMGILTASK